MSDYTAPPSAPERRSLPPLVVFSIRVAVVTVAVTFVLLLVIDEVMADLSQMIDRRIEQLSTEFSSSGKFSVHAFWAHVENQLDKAADAKNDLTPEERQRLLNDVRIIAGRIRPFILQVETAFVTEPDTPAPAPTVRK